MILGGTSVSENNKELNHLHSAERDSDVTKMKSTLPLGFSVDSRNAIGRTPLMNAALEGNVQAVKSLIKRRADPSLMDKDGIRYILPQRTEILVSLILSILTCPTLSQKQERVSRH